MNPQFRPMLAIGYDKVAAVKFPVLATPKFDGIRCITTDIVPPPTHKSVAVCRSLKEVPNNHVRRMMGLYLPPGLDGEILTYTNGKMDPFQMVQSKVMSYLGSFTFVYHVFDFIDINMLNYGKAALHHHYHERVDWLRRWFKAEAPVVDFLHPVFPEQCNDLGELEAFEAKCLAEGYEGVCFRQPDSPYKYGRSTPKEQWLVKMKRFETAEARVVGVVELMRNKNEAEINRLGYQERASHQAMMVKGDTLGALICEPLEGGDTFQLGSGFTQTQRDNLWLAAQMKVNSPIGKIVQYKHQPHGRKDKPRTPIFLGFRDANDLDPQPTPTQQTLL